MRGDMPKVIVERARRGAGWSRKGRALRDDDLALSATDVKAHERMRRAATKSLNENLSPLRRYLERQTGRKWDEVWSEICANLKPTSTVQQHVRDHIDDFVATNTSMIGDEVVVHDRWSIVPLGRARARLYVDPATGILRRNERFGAWRKDQRAAKIARDEAVKERMRVVSRKTQLHRFGDCWWEVTLAEAPLWRTVDHLSPGWRPAFEPDVVHRAGLSRLPRHELYGRSGVYAVAKPQLSKKEMRDLGLPRLH